MASVGYFVGKFGVFRQARRPVASCAQNTFQNQNSHHNLRFSREIRAFHAEFWRFHREIGAKTHQLYCSKVLSG